MSDWQPERESYSTEFGERDASTQSNKRSIEGPDGLVISVHGPEGRTRRRPVLITLDGRRVSERFPLESPRCVLGRDMSADVKVADGEVSREHCIITWDNFADHDAEPKCRLQDMGSTNHTYLNKKKISGVVALHDGDIIRIGRTSLGFFIKDDRVLKLDQMLMTMALHDALTGVYKREYFFSELHREFERSRRHHRPLTLAMLDLDHFKEVNDTYGHINGDTVLREFADLVRMSLREGDICGRYGGEEFAVIFPETELLGAADAVDRIRANVAQHVIRLEDGRTLSITVSGGVAPLDPAHQDKMDLLNDADRALYRAKKNGRNRLEFLRRSEEDGTKPVQQIPEDLNEQSADEDTEAPV
ncbi:MAG: hypothetical protein PWP23_25 [Candidatus Sumerlaeota bacterium]|nr:hypothetical protein [Candidatus Sumerlaeota bacterium]